MRAGFATLRNLREPSAIGRLAVVGRLRAIVAASGDTEAMAELEELIASAPASGPGQRRLATAEALAQRNAALRMAAERFGKNSVALDALLTRYFAGAWKRDRLGDQMPPSYVGTLHELLYIAMKAHPKPPGRRQLDKILGTERAVLSANSFGQDDGSKGVDDVQQVHERGRRGGTG